MSNDSKLKQATYILHSDGNPSDNVLCIDEGGAGGYEYFKLQKDNNNRRFIYEDSNGRAEYEDSIVTEKIRQDLDNEIVRAKQEEARIEGKLDAEITRSTTVDNQHDSSINSLNTLVGNVNNTVNQLRSELNILNTYINELDALKNIKNLFIPVANKKLTFRWDIANGRKIWVCSDYNTVLDTANVYYVEMQKVLKTNSNVLPENIEDIKFTGSEYVIYPRGTFQNPAGSDIEILISGLTIIKSKLTAIQNFT